MNSKTKEVNSKKIRKDIQLQQFEKEKSRIQKKLQELEEINKLKSEFVAVVSHELRTPMTIIGQLVELLYDETAGSINDDQREILRKAKNNVKRLKGMIDELLDISKIESTRFKLRYSLVNFNNLLKDSSRFFKKLAEDKGINLSYHLPKNEITLFIDPERINQVIRFPGSFYKPDDF